MSDSHDPMDYSPSGSSVHEISQARTLEWVAISFPSGSSWCVRIILLVHRQSFYLRMAKTEREKRRERRKEGRRRGRTRREREQRALALWYFCKDFNPLRRVSLLGANYIPKVPSPNINTSTLMITVSKYWIWAGGGGRHKHLVYSAHPKFPQNNVPF